MVISKTLSHQLHELEDHLFLLDDNLNRLVDGDPAFIRQVATELRNLLCLSSGTEGLLWRLCDLMGVEDTVTLSRISSAPQTMPANLVNGMTFAYSPLRTPGSAGPDTPPQPYRLRDVVKQEQSVFISRQSFSFEAVIKVVSQKIGTAHSSEAVPLHLAELAATAISNVQLFFPVLESIGQLALHVGGRVLKVAQEDHGFVPTRRLAYSDQAPILPPHPLSPSRLPIPEVNPVNHEEGSLLIHMALPPLDSDVAFRIRQMPAFKHGVVEVRALLAPTGHLFVTAIGLFTSPITFVSSAMLSPGRRVTLGLTWKRPEVTLFVNGLPAGRRAADG